MQDDEQGHTWQLLNLLDGTRTLTELTSAMQASDPAITADEVDAAVGALIEAGFVKDAAAPGPVADFPGPELERYRRNLEFFEYFQHDRLTAADMQLRLRDARVTVLGLGGLGSHVALSLAAIGVGNLLLVDHDAVELMNLNRQLLYKDSDIGRSKVEAAAERIAEVNPHVRVTAKTMMVDSAQAAQACFTGRDLVICAADRPRVQLYQWLNKAALTEEIAWIRGANDGLTVQLFLHDPHKTACFECLELEAERSHPWFLPMQRYVVEVIGDRTINPCIAPVSGMIGNLAAFEAVRFLTGAATPTIYGHKLAVDLQRMDTAVTEGERLPDCPACGEPALSTAAAGGDAAP
ncbi:MAG TPA: ThiF family adenylyltransferase [Streptosporangiaceae bacterium]|nr:ThiF family adenylyltransferase [Streptosporangiaceae bacterium]